MSTQPRPRRPFAPREFCVRVWDPPSRSGAGRRPPRRETRLTRVKGSGRRLVLVSARHASLCPASRLPGAFHFARAGSGAPDRTWRTRATTEEVKRRFPNRRNQQQHPPHCDSPRVQNDWRRYRRRPGDGLGPAARTARSGDCTGQLASRSPAGSSVAPVPTRPAHGEQRSAR